MSWQLQSESTTSYHDTYKSFNRSLRTLPKPKWFIMRRGTGRHTLASILQVTLKYWYMNLQLDQRCLNQEMCQEYQRKKEIQANDPWDGHSKASCLHPIVQMLNDQSCALESQQGTRSNRNILSLNLEIDGFWKPSNGRSKTTNRSKWTCKMAFYAAEH
jgi:hypothetical protein